MNGYFPNGNGKDRDNSRVPYKLRFYRRLFERLEQAKRAGERILVMGDFNTAHQEIDLARPKENAKTSGFLPRSAQEFDRWIRAGWVDTFRHFDPDGRALHVVEPALRRARAQHRLADRLRAGLARRDAVRPKSGRSTPTSEAAITAPSASPSIRRSCDRNPLSPRERVTGEGS